MKQKKKGAKGVNLVAQLMGRLDSSTTRDAKYSSGMQMEAYPELYSVRGQDFMVNGVVMMTLQPEDLLPDPPERNKVARALQEWIKWGAFEKAYCVDGVDLPNTCILPSQEYLLESAKRFAIPGRSFLEAEQGFKPYLLVGYCNEGQEKNMQWVRIFTPYIGHGGTWYSDMYQRFRGSLVLSQKNKEASSPA